MYDPVISPSSQRLVEQSVKLDCALDLERQLVGVTLHATRQAFEESPEQLLKQAMSYCSMVRLATLGYARKASLAQVRCPGAQRALGLSPVDEEFRSGARYLSLGLYRDIESARQTATQVAIIPEQIHGFSVQPLASCHSLPDVILSICKPSQAMRMLQGYIFHHGPTDCLAGMGMQGVCAELTANPYCNRTMNISLLCSNTRYSCSWGDNELGVGISSAVFEGLVDGVLQTINPAEPDKNKKSILARGKRQGLHMNIRFGSDYYSSPRKLAQNTHTPKKQSAVSLQGVRKSYTRKNGAAVPVLDGIDLTIQPHEFVALIGPSGCGKSTLLQVMAGLIRPDAGEISFPEIAGETTAATSLGYISQLDTLLPWRTVLGNVELGLELAGADKKVRRARAYQLIEQVGLTGFEHCYPFELSGGMKKRVGVIRTLAYDPPVIFMDEPFVGLDVQTRDELEADILRLWRKDRKTIVMVTHDLGEAITLSDRIILLGARPAAVKSEYPVDLPRPRSITETKFTPEFIALHKRIWEDLSNEVAIKAEKN